LNSKHNRNKTMKMTADPVGEQGAGEITKILNF
jgi:hypothetical protein